MTSIPFGGNGRRRWSVPFPIAAFAACLLFAALGAPLVDDYGMGVDSAWQRQIAMANAHYVLGDEDALPADHNRFYGVAFELPLLLAERALGLREAREIHLMRHALSHLFFLVGVFFCGVLAHRLFGGRALALLAMLLFLLHPRLYAHSFFNSKDAPFAAMFMIALALAYRAFDRNTAGAFALCGVAAGLAVDLRIFGSLLLPAVLALRALDFLATRDAAERRRILVAGAVFGVAALATIYAVHPRYWTDPLQFVHAFRTLATHPYAPIMLFQGELLRASELPPRFVPVWFAVTAPPIALAAGAIGIAATCREALRDPRRLLRHDAARFRLLLVVCIALPVAVAVVLQSRVVNGWRHFYFLWGPFSLLAAHGLAVLAGRAGARLGARGAAVGGLAVAGLVATAAQLAALRGHQQLYFNALVDRRTPDALARRYDMDYWGMARRQAVEGLLARYGDATLRFPLVPAPHLLPPAALRRLRAQTAPWQADFYFRAPGHSPMAPRMWPRSTGPVAYEERMYGSAFLQAIAPRLVWGRPRPDAGDYRRAREELLATSRPAVRAAFDVHVHAGAAYFLRETCSAQDAAPRFLLRVYPADEADLPAPRRSAGFDDLDFPFAWRGGFFNGMCLTLEPLPSYPIERIRVGQIGSAGAPLWQATVTVVRPAGAGQN